MTYVLRHSIACFIAVVLLAAGMSRAQTATTTPATLSLDGNLQVDVPPGWVIGDLLPARQAFSLPSGNSIEHVLHLAGSRMTDLPYAVVEMAPMKFKAVPTAAEQQQFADRIAAQFRTFLNPPSRAARPPLWKKSTVSGVNLDPINHRFWFDATITYDFIGDYHVQVVGIVNARRLYVMTIWSDDTYHAAHGAELRAMRDSFRFTAGVAAPPSAKERFLSNTRIFVGLIVALIVGIQIYVLVRDRREKLERRAEAERLWSS